MRNRLIILALLVLIVAAAAFIYTRSSAPPAPAGAPTPTPYSLPTVNSWGGITPGTSTADDLVAKLGPATATTQNGTVTTYSYPSTNQYWKNEVDVASGRVVFVRERIFPPTNTSLKSLTAQLKESPVKLFGPDHASGTYLFVYPQEGIAYLANSFQDTVYQVWRFSTTSIDGFLSLPQASGYSTAPTGQPEGI